MNVPFIDLSRNRISGDIHIIKKVVTSMQFARGSFVAKFEEKFAAKMGFSHCVSVNSGTDALVIAIIASIGRGVAPFEEEIITAPNSFVATAEAIVLAGYKPVFADINPDTHLVDTKSISEKITPKTKAILPVHLYGQACDMHQIYRIAIEKDLFVIEDACQAHGVSINAGRDENAIACYSFYPSKNLGAYGDGGAILVNSLKLKEKMMAIRNHGGVDKNNSMMIGTNSRLDGIQAAILELKLKHLDDWNAKRKHTAITYNYLLSSVDNVKVMKPKRDHVYHLFVVEADKRDDLREFLLKMGINTMVHYPKLIYQQEPYAEFASDCPVAESKTDKILSLPMFPGISSSEIEYVCDSIGKFYKGGSNARKK